MQGFFEMSIAVIKSIESHLSNGSLRRDRIVKVAGENGQSYAMIPTYVASGVLYRSGTQVKIIDRRGLNDLELPSQGQAVQIQSKSWSNGGSWAMENTFTLATVLPWNDFARLGAENMPIMPNDQKRVVSEALKLAA